MVALFEMIVAGFVRFITYFGSWTLFSNSASILGNLRLLSRKAMLIVLVVFMVTYITLMMAFFYYMIDVITTVYNLISSFITMIQSPGGSGGASSPLIQGALHLINASGIAQGVSVAFPFIASALLFRLISKLYQIITKLHEKFLKLYIDVTALVTAS
ncbi:MAG: hypothetical protein Q8R86_06190 [Sulfuricurvum sp.]|nr:hypothetical protein [Sulfuricurvum sp.]